MKWTTQVDWALVTAPSVEPLTLTEAKLQCRVDTTAEDALFTILIAAARSYVEEYLGRALITQTWQLVQEDWTEEIWLPRAAPIQSVTSLGYYDASGAQQTASTSLYVVETVSEPARITRAPNQVWPMLQPWRSGRVIVTYVCGWAAAANVPVPIKQAVALMVAHLYENRQAVVLDNRVAEIVVPLGVEALLAPFRVWWRPSCPVDL